MEEIGIESKLLKDILDGTKTIEGLLGKPDVLQIRVGDRLKLREDIWKDGVIVESIPDQGVIRVTQVLYFLSFQEMLDSLNIEAIFPKIKSVTKALDIYRALYSPEEEEEYGAVAMTFVLE